jgi:alginate O-acetyltransferase complex protein AlgJ
MYATGAGFADQLALKLGFPCDIIAVRGSGATPARVNLLRRCRSDPKYLANKKLVIWCFTAREFSESTGWTKVPVVRIKQKP